MHPHIRCIVTATCREWAAHGKDELPMAWQGVIATDAVGRSWSASLRSDGQAMTTFPGSGERLDWILISPELEFVSYTHLDDTLSDHLGVVAQLRLTEDD